VLKFIDVASVVVGVVGVGFGVWQMQEADRAQAELLAAQGAAQLAAEDLTGVLGEVLQAYESGVADPADVDIDVLRSQINTVLETVYEAQDSDRGDLFQLVTSRIPVRVGDTEVIQSPVGQRVVIGVQEINQLDPGTEVVASIFGGRYRLGVGEDVSNRENGETCTVSYSSATPEENPNIAEFFLDCS